MLFIIMGNAALPFLNALLHDIYNLMTTLEVTA